MLAFYADTINGGFEMKDYTKLWNYLKTCDTEIVRLTFDDIEKLVGFKPGRSFIFDKLESVGCDFEAIDYSYSGQYVVFRKIDKKKKDDDFTTLHTLGFM